MAYSAASIPETFGGSPCDGGSVVGCEGSNDEEEEEWPLAVAVAMDDVEERRVFIVFTVFISFDAGLVLGGGGRKGV